MNMQKLAGYKTLLANTLSMAVLVLGGLTGQITDPVTLRYIAMAIVAMNFALRFLTNGPVGKSPPLVVEEGGKATEVTPAVAAEAAANPGDGV